MFIGSNVNIIAPVNIEDKAYICAGTTVDKDIKKGNFKLQISCLNGPLKEVEGRVFGWAEITSGKGVNIESFFDHITDSSKAGRSFCYADNPQGVDICKSLGKEKISNESYWL